MEYFPERQLEKPTPCAWASALREFPTEGSVRDDVPMLLAYVDEIGETGAFVSKDHPRFNTSPAFGYAGFVIPADRARQLGAHFADQKKLLFSREISRAEHHGRWERKGSDIFRPETVEKAPAQFRVFDALIRKTLELGGSLFYYADQKNFGTPKQTRGTCETDRDMYTARETHAMQETLNRLARHANAKRKNLLVMIDQVNEKDRSERLPRMYSHILGRAADFPEMRRIIEPPMHIDSKLSANIQFADWIAAALSRAIEYQLIVDSRHNWITEQAIVPSLHNRSGRSSAFTRESKLHLYRTSVDDLHQHSVFNLQRPALSTPTGYRIGDAVSAATMHMIKSAAVRSREGAGR